MKKCIVVSDSFKGTLSSQEICTLAAQRLEAYFPGCEVVRIPVADGGEGTVACFHEACGGTLVSVPVSGPYGEAITAEYLQLPGGQAVIEMASAAGLPQVEDRKDPCKTTTYGVGQLIRHAVEATGTSCWGWAEAAPTMAAAAVRRRWGSNSSGPMAAILCPWAVP